MLLYVPQIDLDIASGKITRKRASLQRLSFFISTN